MKPDTPPAVTPTASKPLPWQRIKPASEDPQAAQRVQAIMAHPNYRNADQDAEFMTHPSTRGVRLQVDYLKAEQALEQAGVEHTIVVYGSARLREPATAQMEVATARQQLAARPGDPALQRNLEVAERLLAKSHYYTMARELGQLIAASCPHSCRITLMTGGGPGIMEAANRGAFDRGKQSVGLNITLPHEQYPNPYVTPGLCFSFHYFAMRKLHFLQRAKALIAFPGGYGTLDELFETLTLIQTCKMQPVPVVLVGKAYWQQAINLEFMVSEGVIEPEDAALVSYAESAQQAWNSVLDWHRQRGSALV